MPEPKEEVTQVTEAPEDEGLPIGDAPFEPTEETTVESDEKPTGEETTEAEGIADAITPGDTDATAKADKEIENEVEKLIREATEDKHEDVTPNVQKRFDKLTAEKKALEERLAKLESKEDKASGKSPKYTDDQLKIALKKAWDEGDSELAWQIIDYKGRSVKEELIEMYEKEKNSVLEQQNRINREWNETVDAYSKYADTKVPEIWPGSHKDLDLKNKQGLLYQIADALYWNRDPEKAAYYQKNPGGQKIAVADALTYLVRTKAGKGTQTKVKTLEKRLTKERMKKSPVSGGPSGEEKTSRTPTSAADTLADYISERKKYQEDRGL